MLSLGSGCKNRGHVTHELMHALGFFHEHTRPDRDKFVKILWHNIKSGNSFILSELLSHRELNMVHIKFPLKIDFNRHFKCIE